MLCQKCKKNPGKPYKIYYGEKTGKYTKTVARGTKTTTTYKIGGYEEVYLCKECTRRNPWDAVKFAAITLAVIGLAFFCIYSLISPWEDLLCVPFGIVGGVLFFPWVISCLKILASPGVLIAKEMVREKHEPAGFDTYWNELEYSKLKKPF